MRAVAHALSEGVRRVLAAPAVLIPVAALSLLSPLDLRTASPRVLVEVVVVGSFLAGGIVDRYARGRPTRGYGFFGACGRHFAAMLRLAILEILLYLAADNLPDWRAAAVGFVVVNLVGVYARVRLVVEDRRSAVGAVLAALRFVRRHAGGAVVAYGVWVVALAAVAMVARGAAPILGLPLLASTTIFFQSRLAHVGYTAAAPIQWPESPAAEAIGNHH
jgi:hypothetical protein